VSFPIILSFHPSLHRFTNYSLHSGARWMVLSQVFRLISNLVSYIRHCRIGHWVYGVKRKIRKKNTHNGYIFTYRILCSYTLCFEWKKWLWVSYGKALVLFVSLVFLIASVSQGGKQRSAEGWLVTSGQPEYRRRSAGPTREMDCFYKGAWMGRMRSEVERRVGEGALIFDDYHRKRIPTLPNASQRERKHLNWHLDY